MNDVALDPSVIKDAWKRSAAMSNVPLRVMSKVIEFSAGGLV